MVNSKIIAIHQPNFFPWLGYFDKINRADLFVYLDHVENNPRDPLWTKRVKLIVNKKEYWLTVPIVRPKEFVFVPINKMQVNTDGIWKKHLLTIQQSYGKVPFFDEVFPIVRAFYNDPDRLIANRNIDFIESVCNSLDINTPRIRSSEYKWKKNSTELLIEIVKHFDGDAYMCGCGSGGYQEDEKFDEHGIKLIYQNFQHPTYSHLNSKEFIPGLSIIDALMNLGFSGVKELLNAKNS